jgi:hypothetical protein
VRWTLGRVAAALIFGSLLVIMVAGYVGSQALLGAATITGALGFVALMINILRR